MSVFVVDMYAFENHNKMSAKRLKEILTHMSITSKQIGLGFMANKMKCTE